jgi:hypothetical protein
MGEYLQVTVRDQIFNPGCQPYRPRDPRHTKAVEVAVGATVNLSATMKNQNGSAATAGTFNWSVAGPGATLTAATGASTVFSASADGIYTVKVWDSRWPNQFEDELIFVGTLVGTNAGIAKRSAPSSIKIIREPRRIVIKSSLAGKVSIVSLQGKVMMSVPAGKAGSVVWDTRGAAKGLYLIKVENKAQMLQGKLFVQ